MRKSPALLGFHQDSARNAASSREARETRRIFDQGRRVSARWGGGETEARITVSQDRLISVSAHLRGAKKKEGKKKRKCPDAGNFPLPLGPTHASVPIRNAITI